MMEIIRVDKAPDGAIPISDFPGTMTLAELVAREPDATIYITQKVPFDEDPAESDGEEFGCCADHD
jgi:hypothetical protein